MNRAVANASSWHKARSDDISDDNSTIESPDPDETSYKYIQPYIFLSASTLVISSSALSFECSVWRVLYLKGELSVFSEPRAE